MSVVQKKDLTGAVLGLGAWPQGPDGFSRSASAASHVSAAESVASSDSKTSIGSKRSNATLEKRGSVNTITMTAEEKKAMRAEIEKKKKAAKKRKAEEDRKRRLVEEAERARIAALEFLGARAKKLTPWATITHFAVDLQGFVSVDGERAAPANAAAETLQEADEAWDPDTDEDRVLQGVVGGEFMCCQRQSFPVLSRISGYSEVRSKQQVYSGQKAIFKIKVVKKDRGAWSIGIVRNTVTAGLAWSTSSLKNQVFYLNTAKSNLFNGPLLQYFNSEGTEGLYASDVDFGRTGSSDETTNKGAFFGPNGWVPPINYEFNNHGKFYQIQQDDTIEVEVDLESEDGELKFAINGRKLPNCIKGIRTALLAAPESAEAHPEDAEEEYAGTAGDDHAVGTGTDEDKTEKVSGEEVSAVGVAETDAVGYLLAVQVHSAGDVVRLYGPPQQAEATAVDEPGEGESKTVAESKDESKAEATEKKKRSRKSKSPSKMVGARGSRSPEKATRNPTQSSEASRGKSGTHVDKERNHTAGNRRGR